MSGFKSLHDKGGKYDTDGNLLVSDTAVLDAIDNLTVSVGDVISTGTEDGTPTGTQHVFINNTKNMILATHNRNQTISYADFGTKDERITQIDYTSSIFPGITARKTISYTLVGTKYRRDSIIWSLI